MAVSPWIGANRGVFTRAAEELARPGWLSFVVVLGGAALGVALGLLAALSGVFALISGVVLVICCAVALNYKVGVWVLCLVFPLSQISLMPRQLLGVTGLNPVNLLLSATLGAIILHCVWRAFQHERVALPDVPMPLVLLFIAPVTLAALHGTLFVDQIPEYYRVVVGAVTFDNAGGYLRDVFIKPMFSVLFALAIAFQVRESNNLKLVALPTILGANVVAGLVFLVVGLQGVDLGALSSARSRSFLSGLGMHANEIGLLLNCALSMTLFSMRAATGYRRVLHLVTVVALALAVLLTFSRGGYLGLVVVYAAFLLHSGNFRSLAVTGVVGLAILLALPSEVYERALYGLAGQDRAAISAGRIDQIWIPLLPTLLENPLFGSGLNSILWSGPARSGQIWVSHPHNAYLALLMDMGIVGFLLVMSFFYWVWRSIRAAAKRAEDPYVKNFLIGASIAIPLLFVQGLADDRFTPTTPQSYLWFAIGLAIGFRGSARQSSKAGDRVPQRSNGIRRDGADGLQGQT